MQLVPQLLWKAWLCSVRLLVPRAGTVLAQLRTDPRDGNVGRGYRKPFSFRFLPLAAQVVEGAPWWPGGTGLPPAPTQTPTVD